MRIHLTLPLIDPSPFLIFPESAGRYYEESEHRSERRQNTFPFFNLHCIKAGEGYVEEDGQWQLLHPGDAFLYFPNQPQKYRSSDDNPWDVYWMHFYGDRLPEFLTEQGFRHSIVWSTRQGDALANHLERLIQEVDNRKLLRPSVLSTLAYGVLAEFMSQAVSHRSRRSRDARRPMKDLLPAMQDAACKPFSLEEWAAKIGISPCYFCKLFRKTTQMSPMDFITLCRIRHAKQQLLDDLQRPVGQIAHLCGYPSVSYFIKRFKEKEGVTPAAYRQLHAFR